MLLCPVPGHLVCPRKETVGRPVSVESSSAVGTLLTPKQVATKLQMHVNYVYELATSGEIPSYKFKNNRRFSEAAVDEWLGSQLG